MISARADKKVCPVFLRMRPGLTLRDARFLLNIYIRQKHSVCANFKFFPVDPDFFAVYGNHSGSFSVFYCIGPPPGPPGRQGPEV